MPGRSRSARLRSGAAAAGLVGALALTSTACGVIDKDKKKNKSTSTPKAGAPVKAPDDDDPPAAPVPNAPVPQATPKTTGGPVTMPEVCAVLPVDAVSPVLGTTVVSKPDNIPFTCDYRGPDGKSVLSTTRTMVTVFKAGDDIAPIEEAVAENNGTRIDAEVGVPAAVYTRGTLKTLILMVELDAKNLLKVTIAPEGTAKNLDQAKLVALAKSVVTTVG
ncbi:hypothetical protein [Yinghuangia sp. YIM S09857]|uniref:hypothetical protein n=1 Tax=Yinghuangia sp. YIM S09857 TaxID=3436929 RepID=UPI003F52C573